jgi:hypothetical protein
MSLLTVLSGMARKLGRSAVTTGTQPPENTDGMAKTNGAGEDKRLLRGTMTNLRNEEGHE